MENWETTKKVYFLVENTLSCVHIPSYKYEKVKTPEGYLVQGLIPIDDGRLILNGAKQIDLHYREHKVYILEKNSFIEICKHDFGITGFQMVWNQEFLYLISEKKCQIYSLISNTCRYIEEMKSIHISPGTCSFNNNIYVIGGINNKSIEMYNHRTSHWAIVGTLDRQLFNIRCIQINDEEILIISYKDFFKLNADTGEITYHNWLPIRAKSSKIGFPVKFQYYVYCIIANTKLLRYNICFNKWDIINRTSNCCCLLM